MESKNGRKRVAREREIDLLISFYKLVTCVVDASRTGQPSAFEDKAQGEILDALQRTDTKCQYSAAERT